MRRSLTLVLVLVALIAMTGCKNKPPRIPGPPIGPDSVLVTDTATYQAVTTDPNKDDLFYVIDWKDGAQETTATSKASGDTVSLAHAWSTVGNYAIRVRAKDAKGNWSSDWSDSLLVRVYGDTTPGVNEPPNKPAKPTITGAFWIDSLVFAATSATDPDGDSVRIRMAWGDGMVTTSRRVPSGAQALDSIRYSIRGAKFVRAQAIDPSGDTSAWSDPESIYIDAVNTPPTGLRFVREANPRRGIANGPTYRFYAQATDMQGDSIRYTFYLPNGDSVVSPYTASGVHAAAAWMPTGGPGAYEYRVRCADQLGLPATTTAVDTFTVVGEGQIIWAMDNDFVASPALSRVESYDSTFPAIVCGTVDGVMLFIDAYQAQLVEQAAQLDQDAFTSSPAVGANGRFYSGNADGNLYAYDPTGDTVWRWGTGDGNDVSTSPLVDGNLVYFGGEDKKLHKVVDNGATWSEEWGGGIPLHSELVSSPVMDPSGNIITCDDSGYVTSVTASGSVNWSVPIGDSLGITSSPAVWTDGTIYVGSEGGRLFAIKDGSILWHYEVPWTPPNRTPVSSSPIFGADGNIYFPADDGKLYRIDPATHDTVPGWPKTVSTYSITCTPALCADGVFYVADDDDTLRAVSDDGAVRWSLDLTVPPPMRKGNGHPRRLGFDGQPSPMIDQYGIIYISSPSGIFAVAGRAAGTLATTPWPMFRHDVRHTGKYGARR